MRARRQGKGEEEESLVIGIDLAESHRLRRCWRRSIALQARSVGSLAHASVLNLVLSRRGFTLCFIRALFRAFAVNAAPLRGLKGPPIAPATFSPLPCVGDEFVLVFLVLSNATLPSNGA